MPIISTVSSYIFKSLLLTTIKSKTPIKIRTAFMRQTSIVMLSISVTSKTRDYFKVWLTYQKQLFKSCVCNLDILQRWKAAWQVIRLQEFIGSFANCLIDSKSNQDIKAFCFTSQIMHQLLSLKTKLIGMVWETAVRPKDINPGKLMASMHF